MKGFTPFLGGSDGKASVYNEGDDPRVGKIPWRRKWQPAPVCMPRKFHGQRSLASYSQWGYKRDGYNYVTKTTTTERFVQTENNATILTDIRHINKRSLGSL